ncbi:MAG: sensor histidine kinase [Terracidiphilus sp.]|jgi:signal transduction histidine kinase
MQQTGQAAGWGGTGRKRVEDVVGTLADLRSEGENLAELAHDARNMVTALGLYCDLLEEPGVLATPYLHYGNELRLVAAASRRLVEKLAALDRRDDVRGASLWARLRPAEKGATQAGFADQPQPSNRWDLVPAVLIDNLAEELLANRNLLAALAGPAIALMVDTELSALPVNLDGEDLTRVLVNLVKNAAEAMPAGGSMRLTLRERPGVEGMPKYLVLTIEDSGPGIPAESLHKVFEAGFSTHSTPSSSDSWPCARRGLGLSISRSIIEASGGRIFATNSERGGARLSIELPVRTR